MGPRGVVIAGWIDRQAGKSGEETGQKKIKYKVQLLAMRPYQREQGEEQPVTIGYYPLRGKAQICRLLCEYLHVPYVDMFFTPDQWNKFREGEAAQWVVRDLPFLRDQDFIVTGPSAIVHYVIQRAGRSDLLGRTLADRILIDSMKSKHDLSGAVLGLVCSARPSLSPDEKKDLTLYWASKIEPILRDYQHDCPQDGWYLGYLTVVDFFVYELLNLVSLFFPDGVSKFTRLVALQRRFGCLPQIRNYESSSRALSEYCPVRYFSRFKQEKMRSTSRPNLVIKDATKLSPMDVE